MNEPTISLAELREYLGPHPERDIGFDISGTVLLALLEATEAAHAYWTAGTVEVGDTVGSRLNTALCRFDFA